MKIFRTTKYYGDRVWFTRYSVSKVQFAAVKGAAKWAAGPWYLWGGNKKETVRVTLDMIEVPDDAWVRVDDWTKPEEA